MEIFRMYRTVLLGFALASCVYSSALAQENPVAQISPIFSQLVRFAFPAGFKTVNEKTNGNNYIRESVLDGETVDQWTQMITVTGAKGLAANASVTPELFVTQIAAGFKRACPDTFDARRLGAIKISGQDAFAGVAGCGTVITSITPHSESALLIAIKGTADYYTIQWAERGPASNQRPDLGGTKWADRFTKLNPIRLCPLLPGEAPPYPSCANQN